MKHTTEILISKGLKTNNKLQQINGVWIYPWDVFCPQSFYTKKMNISPNTVSIHFYSESWNTPYNKFKKMVIRHIGKSLTILIVRVKRKFQKV